MIKPKILLHICCAPCSIPVIKFLEKRDFVITGFWYNPNIWPKEEYEKRFESLIKYESKKRIPIIYDDSWFPQLDANLPSDKRCSFCYEARLYKTAERAEQLGFDFFTTTLLVSPYQKHEIIKNLSEDISQDFGVNFYYEDFRPLFYSHKKEAKELGLYHQSYCGCQPSIKEADIKEAEETRKKQREQEKAKKNSSSS